MPAPSAIAEEVAPFANKIFLSSTVNVAVFNVTTSPCTVKLPATTKLFKETSWPTSADTALAFVKYKFDPSRTFDVSNPTIAVAVTVVIPTDEILPFASIIIFEPANVGNNASMLA